MKTKLSGFFAVAALAVAMASTASATELCAGITNVNTIGSAGCVAAGDPNVVFSDFSVEVTGAASAEIGISGTTFSGSEIVLDFQISLTDETIPGSADIELSYVVTGGIDGVDDVFQASPLAPGGDVTISEIACAVPFVAACPLPNTNTLANYAGISTGQLQSNSATFPSGEVVNPVYIDKDIDISNAAMSGFANSQMVSSVPETATFSLMGAGLLGLGLLRRRFLTK